MPRDSNGNYTLPAGNPVVTGEVISTGWANPTMSDLGAEITNSLDRQGRGGMLAPFKFVDGTNSQPGMTWTNEPTTGFYRAGGADMRATVAGVSRMRWTGSGCDVYDAVAGTWVALANSSGVNFAVKNATNKFTEAQVIVNTSASLQLWKDATPTIGGRFAFNVGVADNSDLSHFNGTGWRPRFVFGAGSSSFYADAYGFFDEPGNVRRAYLDIQGLQVGSNVYSAVTGALRYVSITAEAGNAGELGVYANDGTNNLRAALFAAPTAFGIDCAFGSGSPAFEFRRFGTPIFNMDSNGINMVNGHQIGFVAPGNGSWTILKHGADNLMSYDTPNEHYFKINSTVRVAVNQDYSDHYYTHGSRYFDATNSYATILWENGTQFRVDVSGGTEILYTINGSSAFVMGSSFNVYAGRGINLYSSDNGTSGYLVQSGTALLINTPADGYLLVAGAYSYAWTNDRFVIRGGRALQFNNSGDSASQSITYAQDSGGNPQLNMGGRGSIMHWSPGGYSAGDISVQTTDPAASGGRPGQMVLVYE